jgi:hypothetical protein
MKKSLSLLILFVGVISFSFSQEITTSKNFNYSISKPYDVVDGKKWYISHGEEVLAIKQAKKNFVLQKFSGDKLDQSKRNTGELLPKSAYIEAIISMSNKETFIFYSLWDKPNEKEQLFKRKIDFDEAKFVGKDEKIIEVDGKLTGSLMGGGFMFSGMKTVDKFDFSLSLDDSKLLIKYRKKPLERDDQLNKDLIGMYVYNSNFEEIWNNEIEMPYTESKMNNIGYTIDEKGSVFILTEIYKDDSSKKFKKSGELNVDLHLMKIEDGDSEIEDSEIDVEGLILTDIGFYEGQNNSIVIGGFYAKRRAKFFGPSAGAEGFYMYKLGKDGELLANFTYEIPVEIMKQYVSKRTQKIMARKENKGREIDAGSMVLRDIIFHDNGVIDLIGEKYFVTSSYNAKTGRTTYTYHYQEMLITSISKDGEMKWIKKLPKYQTSGSSYDNGCSFYHMFGKEDHYLIFMDNVKNLNLPENQFPAKHGDGAGGFLTGYKVNYETGDWERFSIFDSKKAKGMKLYQFKTSRIEDLSKTSFAVEFYKKKKQDVMIRVNLEE